MSISQWSPKVGDDLDGCDFRVAGVSPADDPGEVVADACHLPGAFGLASQGRSNPACRPWLRVGGRQLYGCGFKARYAVSGDDCVAVSHHDAPLEQVRAAGSSFDFVRSWTFRRELDGENESTRRRLRQPASDQTGAASKHRSKPIGERTDLRGRRLRPRLPCDRCY